VVKIRFRHAALIALAGLAPAAARAAGGVMSGVADFRLAAADGETSWLAGGFGKTRLGSGGDGDLKLHAVPAFGELIVQPPLTWNLRATLVLTAQQGPRQPLDVSEALVTWKPLPRGPLRLSARAGLFWPPVSLEHEGAGWIVPDMITPSAINSWIGEEVKMVAAEGTVARDMGGGRVAATFALFGFNDTAGTLLAFRGWAMHDVTAGAFGHRRLPPLNPFMQDVQAPSTRPVDEVDGRLGFYAKLAWSPAAPVSLEAFHYRNRGTPDAVTDRLQWGWDTRFWNVGARVDLGPHTRLLAQALTGTTEMGVEEDEHYWVETRYRAAYLRLIREQGPLTLTGRLDLFGTRERGSEMGGAESEGGWAATAAASWALSPHAKLILEGLRIDSDRGARARTGLAPGQRQNQLQAALRLTL
jgi:hypothetical protein